MKIEMLLFIIFILLTIPGFADYQPINSTQAESAINEAKADMEGMIKAGFNIIRVNDTINIMEQEFQAQLALEEKGGTPDYSLVINNAEKLKDIKDEAFEASDELKALENIINEKEKENINLTQTLILFEKAKNEFNDERYEQVAGIVKDVYDELSKAESEATALRAFYIATTRTLKNFLRENWLLLISISIAALIIYAFGRNAISRYRIKRKIRKLEIEKEVIKHLIKKAQKDYFERNKISESSYKIKIKKFAEMIRDIDRQIPVLKEELTKKKGKIAKKD